MIDRTKKLTLLFPNLSIVKIMEHGLVIEDSKTGNVIKVFVKGKTIVCSDKSKLSDEYILYATLHPQFWF